MPVYRENRPEANALMVSMRSMGYTFEAAIADIIDNSISAGASRVELKFPTEPIDCFVAICDNGRGMDKEKLFRAMKYGSNVDGVERLEGDLGRFGLGLKSASFSQCRKLTVISKQHGMLSAFCWDLDHIEKDHCAEWELAEYSDDEIRQLKFADWLDNYESGTVVLWQDFDFLEKSTGSVFQELSAYTDLTSNYISLIFHRYLNRSDPGKLILKVNDYQVEGLDPFLEDHKKTNARRVITLPVNDSEGIERQVIVQPFVLPFQKDMSKEDIRRVGGVEDYRTKQGFYIYRNERLIIWGTWFGKPKNELTKHARVKVDIPNALDDIWSIDIKKQNARIPKIIRNRLTKAVEEAMDIAVRAQTYRGRVKKADEETDYIWDRIEQRDNSFIYQINRNSRIFSLIKDSVDDATWNRIDMVLEEIEKSVPYHQIYIDKSQNKVYEEKDADRAADVEAKAHMLIDMALKFGTNTSDKIIEELFRSEPFNAYPELKDKLLEEYH